MIENVILTAIVMAICQATKPLVDGRWVPLIALTLGVGGAFLVPPSQPVEIEVVEGLISGLVAVGLYSGAKNTLKPTV